MAEQQKITILINGKEKLPYKDGDENETAAQEETAAAIHEAGHQIPLSFSLALHEKVMRKKRRAWRPASGRPSIWKGKAKIPKKLALSVAGAVLTGILFGLAVLMVFSTPTEQIEAQPAAVRSIPAEKEKKVAIPDISLSFAVVQAGVFSSADIAAKRESELKEKGMAAATVIADKGTYVIVSGLGDEKSQIKDLAASYEEKGIDVFEKEQLFTFGRLLVPDKMDESYMVNGRTLLQNIVTLYYLPVDENKAKTVASTLRDFEKWKSFGKQQSKAWPAELRNKSRRFEGYLSAMLGHIKEQDKKEDGKAAAFHQSAADALGSFSSLMYFLQHKK